MIFDRYIFLKYLYLIGGRVNFEEVRVHIDELEKSGYIPFGYHADFIDLLSDNPDIFQVITYNDLKWQKGCAADLIYSSEKSAWDKAMRNGELDPRKIYVLIQHDVDSHPQRTMNLLKYESSREVPSNVMIFNQRVNRRHYISTGEVELTDYPLDFDLLRELQRQGFVVGYHMNAYEQSGYNQDLARDIFKIDINALNNKLGIEFFSAHGGAPGPNNINNRDITLEGADTGLIWVHNGKTPIFDDNYSDGGLNSPLRDPAKRDLRDFVKKWKPGKRYRVLTHPQYYHLEVKASKRMSEAGWYMDVLRAYDNEITAKGVWADVRMVVQKHPMNQKLINQNGLFGKIKKLFKN